MRTRIVLAALLLVTACGEAGPTPGFQPLEDSPRVATGVAVTTTSLAPDLQLIDTTVRNPFERP
jgi:hypothetical protein